MQVALVLVRIRARSGPSSGSRGPAQTQPILGMFGLFGTILAKLVLHLAKLPPKFAPRVPQTTRLGRAWASNFQAPSEVTFGILRSLPNSPVSGPLGEQRFGNVSGNLIPSAIIGLSKAAGITTRAASELRVNGARAAFQRRANGAPTAHEMHLSGARMRPSGAQAAGERHASGMRAATSRNDRTNCSARKTHTDMHTHTHTSWRNRVVVYSSIVQSQDLRICFASKQMLTKLVPIARHPTSGHPPNPLEFARVRSKTRSVLTYLGPVSTNCERPASPMSATIGADSTELGAMWTECGTIPASSQSQPNVRQCLTKVDPNLAKFAQAEFRLSMGHGPLFPALGLAPDTV